MSVALALAVWTYALVLLAVVLLMYPLGDRFWLSTLVLLGPRWVVGAPLLVLLPASLALGRRWLVLLIPCALVVAGPILGFCVPWRSWLHGRQEAPSLRVLTLNLGGFRRDPAQLQAFGQLMDESRPDVAVFQECQASTLLPRAGFNFHHASGLCLLSRLPIEAVYVRDPSDVWKLSGSGAIVRYRLGSPQGPIALTNVHLETPREGIEAMLFSPLRGIPELVAKNEERKLEARLARAWVDLAPEPGPLVAGDFNMTVESAVFREHWQGFRDAFSEGGLGLGHTKHTRRIGTRIDHVLMGDGWRCVSARVSEIIGLDHGPLVVELVRDGPPGPGS